MDYINPVSIAQMFERQKDTSLPGAGYGALQGFLEGQAAADSRQFLQQSQAAQAQDFVKQQFDNEKAWMDRPYELEKRGVELDNLRQTGANSKLTGEQLRLNNEELARNPRQKALELIGAHYDRAATLKSPLERRQFAEALHRKAKLGGYPILDFDYQEGNEQSWQEYVEMLRMARDSSLYTNQLANQRTIATNRNDNDRYISDSTNQSRERMNALDNATRAAGDRLQAEARKASEEGQNAWNNFKVIIAEQYKKALVKSLTVGPDNKLTPEEQAALQMGPEILSPGYASTRFSKDPEREGEAAGAKTRKEIEELRKALKGNVTTDPGKAEPAPLPESERDLQKRLERYP